MAAPGLMPRIPLYKEVAATATTAAEAEAARSRADATATAQAAPVATKQALEAHYLRGIGYINLKQWAQAKGELELVFEVDPNYKDVQAQLALIGERLASQQSTSTPTPLLMMPTPQVIVAANLALQGKIEVSSVYPSQPADRFSGSKAVDGAVEDTWHEWTTNGEGAGAWLKITFPTVKHLNEIILYDRPNPIDHVLQGKLIFSDGSELKTGDLPNAGGPRKLSFEQKSITWVKFIVVQSAGLNIGLAEIEVYGW